MAPIVIDSARLNRDRRQAVRRLVTPLLPESPNVIIERVGSNRDIYTLSVLPRGRAPGSYLTPETPLVATSVPKILMNYYESWRQSDQADVYYLERMYMHLHLAIGAKPRQVFSLHCDLSLKDGDVHFRYGRGPHVHVEGVDPNSVARISPFV